MTPNEMKAHGYPNNIDELITETEGVQLIEDATSHYVIHDGHNGTDCVLQINKTSCFDETYFEFFGNKVDKEKVYTFARTLPPLLFMNLKKVYFVEKDEDLLGEVDQESPNHTFRFNDSRQALGMAIFQDSVAFVNLRELKAYAEEEIDNELNLFGYSNEADSRLYHGICETLAHELFHLAQFNPLIEALIPWGEEPTEEFCRHYGNS